MRHFEILREADTGSGTEASPDQQATETAPSSDDAGGFLSGDAAKEPEVEGFLAGDKEPEGDAPANADEAPAEYDFKLPEGFEETEESKAYLDEIKSFASALKLSPEQAQQLLEIDAKAKFEAHEAQTKQTEEQQKQAEVEKLQAAKEQIETTKADLKKEWGADMDKNVRAANRALKSFGGPELEGVLKTAGVLNDPVVLKAFHKAGLSLVEDSSPGGAGATRRNRSAAEILYPSSTKEG